MLTLHALGIAGFYSGLHVLLFIALSILVSRERWRSKVRLGVGNDARLLRIVRVHGNAAEYLPPILVLILLMALLDVGPLILHFFGLTTLAGRILHASGVQKSENYTVGRSLGTWLTWLSLVWASIMLIVLSLMRG